MVIVEGTESKGKPGKEREPKDESSLGNVSYFIGALPATEDPGEKKKVAKPTVPGPSQAPQEAAAERVGSYIGAGSPIEKDQEIARSPKAKRSKAQTSEKAPAKRVGKSIGAVTPIEEDKNKEKPKASRGKRPKAQTEKRSGHYTGAIPAVEEAPAKREPAEKAKASNCGFGWVELKGNRYEFDVIVHVDGSVMKRDKRASKKKKEKYGHTPLTRKELKELGKEAPVMIIIGTGHSGSMPLTPKVERFLEDYLYFVGTTPMALEKLATCEEKAVALLHVTC